MVTALAAKVELSQNASAQVAVAALFEVEHQSPLAT